MAIRTQTGVLALALAAGLAACSDSGLPTAPTATAASPVESAPTAPRVGQPVNGSVSDSALRPVAGARVELLDGPQAGVWTTSDEKGAFVLFGTVDDTTRFRASKEGLVTADVKIMPDCERCNPRRWVHFFLNVLDQPAALAGDYSLMFVADPACSNLPPELRTRTYEATVALGDFSWWGFPAGAKTSFKVTPKGAAFPGGLNFFWLNVAGNVVAVVLGDHSDPGVTEQISDNTYLAFNGWATVSVEPNVATIATPFEGWIDYCVNPNMGERYNCSPGGVVKLDRCNSSKHQLILTRR